jgi:hypothetical protein
MMIVLEWYYRNDLKSWLDGTVEKIRILKKIKDTKIAAMIGHS